MKDWKQVKLGSLLTESKVIAKNPDTNKRLTVRLNMLGVEKRAKVTEKEGATKYFVRKAGQFIYGKQNLHNGAFGIIPKELDGFESSLDIPAFDVDASAYPEWIYYFFKKGGFYSKLEGLAKGIGSKRIQPDQIFSLNIILPPKKKQRNILDRVLHLEKVHDKILSEIKSQEYFLRELRKSILDDAVKGNLTADWREKNLQIKTAANFLEEIKSAKGQVPSREKVKDKNNLPVISNEDYLFDIPDKWIWRRFGDVAIIESNLVKPQEYLSYPHIAPDSIEKNTGVLLSFNTVEQDRLISAKHLFYSNHILYSKIRPHLNKVVMVDFEGLCSADMYPIRSLLFPDYLFRFMLSPTFVQQSTKVQGRVAMPKINQVELNKILIAVPPLEEQMLIARKVENLLIISSKLEKEIVVYKREIEELLSVALVKLIGKDSINVFSPKNETNRNELLTTRIKFDSKSTFMELVDLLASHGKLHAEDLWKRSKHFDVKNIDESIDKFYADLKMKIEVDKSIREVDNEKGYLELI